MEKLIARNTNGDVYKKCYQTCPSYKNWKDCETCVHMYDIFEKLAAYEDTGLRPEEIKAAADKRLFTLPPEDELTNYDRVRMMDIQEMTDWVLDNLEGQLNALNLPTDIVDWRKTRSAWLDYFKTK